MFIRPLESAAAPKIVENVKNIKFISAYEAVPKPIEAACDKFYIAGKKIVSAPKSVLESITRIFW